MHAAPFMSLDIGALLQVVQQLIPWETSPAPGLDDVRAFTRLLQIEQAAVYHSVVLPHFEKSYVNFLRQFQRVPVTHPQWRQWVDSLHSSMGRLAEIRRNHPHDIDAAADACFQRLQQEKIAVVKAAQKEFDNSGALPALERPHESHRAPSPSMAGQPLPPSPHLNNAKRPCE